MGSKDTQILVMNLKRDYDKALKELKEKDEVIDNLEKNKKSLLLDCGIVVASI